MCCSDHYNVVIMRELASQITVVSIVCSTVCSGADQRKHQNSASLAFVRRIHRRPVDSPYKRSVTRKMFPFDGIRKLYIKPALEWYNSSAFITQLAMYTLENLIIHHIDQYFALFNLYDNGWSEALWQLCKHTLSILWWYWTILLIKEK